MVVLTSFFIAIEVIFRRSVAVINNGLPFKGGLIKYDFLLVFLSND
jgi:hypothetical protein